jgi:hypothetical protein
MADAGDRSLLEEEALGRFAEQPVLVGVAEEVELLPR